MATEAQLQEDLTRAMKARATDEMYVLRGVLTAIKNLKVEKQVKELADGELAVLIRKEIGKRDEAIEFAVKGGRADVIAENERQKAILQKYLPRQLDKAELESVIRQLSTELVTTSIGPIMAKLRERHPGQFDGQLASQLIRALGS